MLDSDDAPSRRNAGGLFTDPSKDRFFIGTAYRISPRKHYANVTTKTAADVRYKLVGAPVSKSAADGWFVSSTTGEVAGKTSKVGWLNMTLWAADPCTQLAGSSLGMQRGTDCVWVSVRRRCGKGRGGVHIHKL